MKKKTAIHLAPMTQLRDGKFVTVIDRREVRVMVIAEGYAMVRRKGCMPYVAPVKELEGGA